VESGCPGVAPESGFDRQPITKKPAGKCFRIRPTGFVAGLTLFQAEGLVDTPDRIVAEAKTARK